jgi:two-component sensor histidine kinase
MNGMLGCWLIMLCGSFAQGAETLRTCGAVHELNRSEAGKGMAVSLEGVITNAAPEGGASMIIQDESGGTYVTLQGIKDRHPVGTLVRVTGRTDRGGHAPIVVAEKVEALGDRAPPAALPARLADMQRGRMDCLRVTLQAVLRRMEMNAGHGGQVRLEMLTLDGPLSVMLADGSGLKQQANSLINALIQVEGVCFTQFNSRGEALGSYLRAPDHLSLSVISPGGGDPFSAPLASDEALLPYPQTVASLHRQRLRGVVILHYPGDCIYLETGTAGYRVELRQEGQLQLGKTVECSGFAIMKGGHAVLTDAVWRLVSEETLQAQAKAVTRQEIFSGGEDHEGRLVSLKGALLKVEAALNDRHRIYLDHEGHIILAHLPPTTDVGALTALQEGSELKVTGVCSIELTPRWPQLGPPLVTGVRLHLRSPGDVEVLSLPAFWNTQRLVWALGGLGLVAGLLTLWALLLRRQVKQQTEALSATIRRESVLEERQRIASELHDTLYQEVAGIGILVSHAASDATLAKETREQLLTAERMARRCRVESRHSINDLQSVVLEQQGLAVAIQEAAAPLATVQGAAFHFVVIGSEVPLPAAQSTTLIRVAHEAAANAGRHSGAANVWVELSYEAGSTILRCRDDGKGFDPNADTQTTTFGLPILRQRVSRAQGTLKFESSPGHGTLVEVTLPLSNLQLT